MFLVDSHCHLDYAPPEARADIIARARSAGVRTLLTICTKLGEFEAVRAIAAGDPDIWCSVGVHPHEAAAEPEADTAALVARAGDPKVVGLGETGLDFYYDHSPRPRQAELFRAHAQAARETGLPLIVHTRDADPETIQILREERLPSGVIHCFSTGAELAAAALELGFYLSLAGIVTFKSAGNLREIVRGVPLDRLLVETDSPYLAPVPMRGKTNEPAFVVHTAAAVAALKGVPVEELAARTSANFFALFKKAVPPRDAACG